MAINISNILSNQKNLLLSKQEGHFLDFKSIDIKPANITKHIAAFANADGGELYIGIDENKNTDTRVWRGFKNLEAANGFLQVFEELFPLGQEFHCRFLSYGSDGLVLQFEVHKTLNVKKASDGKVYIRRGAQSLPVDSQEGLMRLQMNKGIVSFETETVSADLFEITNSEPIISFLVEVIPTAEPSAWLKKQQLIRNDKPTVAGVLLFAEEPQAIIPKRCAIKIYRYKTTDTVGSRDTLAFNPITIDGCIYEQIHASVNKTVEIVQNISKLGIEGLEKITYPLETLHEIITNAVLHRDYSIADDVHVRIFDNRIEIESPGKLPGHVTVNNILKERFARNGNVVRLINKFPDPPNKDVGEGLNTAFEAMRKLKLKEPVIEQRENSLIVYIRHELLASPEEIIINYLEKNPYINNSKGREICHIGSENVMKRILQRLVDRGLIERVPERKGKASAYQKK